MNAVPLYVLAIVLVGLATHVRRASGAEQNRRFAAFTLAVAGWVLGIAGVETGIHTEFWGRITFASGSLIATSFARFSHVFPAPTRLLPPVVRLSITVAGVTLAVLALTTSLIAYDIIRTEEGIRRTEGPLYAVFAAFLLLSIVGSVALFVHKWTESRGRARAQAQYVVLGILVFASGATTTNLIVPLITGRSSYSWLGPYFTLPFIALVAHSIIRHRLMDLRLIVHRWLVNIVLLLAVTAVLTGTFRAVFGDVRAPGLRVDALLVVCVIFAILTAPAQKVINHLLNPYLYRGRVDYTMAVRDATHLLTRLMEPHAFAAQIRRLLSETIVPDTAAVILFDNGRPECLFSDFPETFMATVAEVMNSLANKMISPSVILIVPSAPPAGITAVDPLHSAGVEVVVVLQRRDSTLGIILLGARRSGEAYFAEELEFLEALSELTAIALENNLLHQQRVHILEYSERLLESLDSAVVAIDTMGLVTSYNPAATRLLNISSSQTDITLSALPAEVAWALALAVRGAWDAKNVEGTISRSVDSSLPVVLSTAVLRDANRALIGALVVITDLSAVKALERNQRRLEHLSLMARFYAGLAHEIRNPLAAISNFVSMLPDRFDDPEYRDTASRLLPLEVARITALSDRLRLMAPGAGGKLTSVNVRPLLTDIIAIHAAAARERNVRITLNCQASLPQITADPSQLTQLFINLFRNGIDAMPEGGTIRVEAAASSGNSVDRTVAVCVIDEGIGIDPSTRSSLFVPFFTTKPTGTGLGLAICREIATFHGAQLSIMSRSDRQGTVVEVRFPVTHEPTAAEVTASASPGMARTVAP